MRKSIAFLILLCLLAAAGVFAEQADPEDSAQEPVTLSMGMIAPTGHPVEVGSQYFADLVEERTDGQVLIEVYPDGVLGDGFELANQAKLGTVDIVNLGCGVTAATIPEYNITTFYYVWKDDDHMRAFFNSDLVEELNEQYLDETGIRILTSNWEQGYRHMVAKRPVYGVEDLNGVKIRVPQLDTFVESWKAMGANPTPMAFGEVYTALQQNVVDAIEVPMEWIHKAKFYEQAPYVILTGHLGYPNQVQINDDTFQQLTAEQQEILIQAAIEAGEYSSKLTHDSEAGLRSDMEAEGVTFIDVDRAEFAEKVYQIVPDFESLWGVGFWDQVQNISY